MDKEEKKLLGSIKRATILSGIGMGLLLGIIMGLSVSEVVKVIMGVLTALLGAFLGFDRRSFAGMSSEEYDKEKQNSYFTALRAGWFGLAVVAGILSGIFIRTHELLNISIQKSVKQWTDAGYKPDFARSLVTFQRLGMDPNTGKLGEITTIQRGHNANLFSSRQALNLCGEMDPYQWNNDWDLAKEGILALNDSALAKVVAAIEENVSTEKRFGLLTELHSLLCVMGENDTQLCNLGNDLAAWQNDKVTSKLAAIISTLSIEKQQKVMFALSEFVCKLEIKTKNE